MLSLIHLRHELVELVVAVRFDLLQEIIHLEGLAVARYLPSRQHILRVLREAHVVLVHHLLMLERVLLSGDYLDLIPLLPIAAYRGMARVIQIWDGYPECRVA